MLLVLLLSLFGSSHTAQLQWTASATSGVTYSVYRRQMDTQSYVRRAANIKATSWSDQQVKSGKTYRYVVRAVKTQIESPDSNEVIAVIPQ